MTTNQVVLEKPKSFAAYLWQETKVPRGMLYATAFLLSLTASLAGAYALNTDAAHAIEWLGRGVVQYKDYVIGGGGFVTVVGALFMRMYFHDQYEAKHITPAKTANVEREIDECFKVCGGKSSESLESIVKQHPEFAFMKALADAKITREELQGISRATFKRMIQGVYQKKNTAEESFCIEHAVKWIQAHSHLKKLQEEKKELIKKNPSLKQDLLDHYILEATMYVGFVGQGFSVLNYIQRDPFLMFRYFEKGREELNDLIVSLNKLSIEERKKEIRKFYEEFFR